MATPVPNSLGMKSGDVGSARSSLPILAIATTESLEDLITLATLSSIAKSVARLLDASSCEHNRDAADVKNSTANANWKFLLKNSRDSRLWQIIPT